MVVLHVGRSTLKLAHINVNYAKDPCLLKFLLNDTHTPAVGTHVEDVHM